MIRMLTRLAEKNEGTDDSTRVFPPQLRSVMDEQRVRIMCLWGLYHGLTLGSGVNPAGDRGDTPPPPKKMSDGGR